MIILLLFIAIAVSPKSTDIEYWDKLKEERWGISMEEIWN